MDFNEFGYADSPSKQTKMQNQKSVSSSMLDASNADTARIIAVVDANNANLIGADTANNALNDLANPASANSNSNQQPQAGESILANADGSALSTASAAVTKPNSCRKSPSKPGMASDMPKSASSPSSVKAAATRSKPYSAQRADYHIQKIRLALSELPVFCADYLRSIASNTTPLTRLAYIGDIRTFLTYLTLEVPKFSTKAVDSFTYDDIANIKKRDIDMYLEYLDSYIINEYAMNDDGSPEAPLSSVERTNTWPGKQRKLATVRSLFSYLYKEELIPANTAELVDMPRTREKPIIRLEANEMLDLLDTADSGIKLSERQQKYHDITRLRDVAMLMLMLGTGLRVGECIGINIADLDFTLNAMLITRKGDKEMILYFSDEVAEALKAYLVQREQIEALPGHEYALFLSIQRKRMCVRAVEKMVKKYAQIAVPLKRRISPHKLRTTFGTNLYRETGDIYLVADVMGHSDVNTTRSHYAEQSDESRRKAARAIKLREE